VRVVNTGDGPGISVVLRDDLSPYSAFGLDTYGPGLPFSFTDSFPASGLTPGTPEYTSDKGATWSYLPVSGGGGAPAGYDGDVTGFRLPMTGTMNANGANFTIRYTVRVK
jgi:trimeric autotransporter adhesin